MGCWLWNPSEIRVWIPLCWNRNLTQIPHTEQTLSSCTKAILCHLCWKWPDITLRFDRNSLILELQEGVCGCKLQAQSQHGIQHKLNRVWLFLFLLFGLWSNGHNCFNSLSTHRGDVLSFPMGCKVHAGTKIYRRYVPKHLVLGQLQDLNAKCHDKNITFLSHRGHQMPVQ